MGLGGTLQQEIAVFGESGSGKTVLLSSFYGAAQEPQFVRKSLFRVVADDFGQGARLHQNYLGMKNSAKRPEITRFSATAHSFSIKLKDGDAKNNKGKPFDAVRLIWHDYPGEWFEQGVSGPEEAKRRVDTFRSLLGSDVALLLVDGQRLLDNSGEEERYLKSLLANVKNALLVLKDDLLEDGQPLVEFPRIWIMALSKADLLPEMNVFNFRDLVIEKAREDLEELRNVLEGLVEVSEALSVGEDFMLLSSAKFEVDKIEVTKRVGLDLILPLAATLPFERLARWHELREVPWKVLDGLLMGAGAFAVMLVGKGRRGGIPVKAPGPIGAVVGILGFTALADALNDAARLGSEKLEEIHSEALAQQHFLTATLAEFRLKLNEAEDERVLIRSFG